MLRWRLLVVGLAFVLGACSTDVIVKPALLPDNAVAVGPEVLVTDELVDAADLHEGDELYRLAAADDHSVLVRLRTGQPPLLLGTSCDVVNSVLLSEGWEGVCLEYTLNGRRVHGSFPHGTSSVTRFPGTQPSDSPEAAVVAAHVGDLEFAQELVGRMVVVYADANTVDMRGRDADEGFCRSYAVFGVKENGRFTYWANPAMACDFRSGWSRHDPAVQHPQ